jgi:hypothetical protein
MFPNLKAEMARKNVTISDLARAIHRTDRSVRDKVSGKGDFSWSEINTIRDQFFHGQSIEMTETMEKAVALANEESPSKVLASIPRDKLISIPNEICSLLTGNDLSFQQAEMLLEVAKGRLRRVKI